jgi:hypothetical protein
MLKFFKNEKHLQKKQLVSERSRNRTSKYALEFTSYWYCTVVCLPLFEGIVVCL